MLRVDIDAQYNTGSDELNVPNLMPDFHTRVAFNGFGGCTWTSVACSGCSGTSSRRTTAATTSAPPEAA